MKNTVAGNVEERVRRIVATNSRSPGKDKSPTTRAVSRRSKLDQAGEIEESPSVSRRVRAPGCRRVVAPTNFGFEQDSDIESPLRKSQVEAPKSKEGSGNSLTRSKSSEGSLGSDGSDSNDESRPSNKRKKYLSGVEGRENEDNLGIMDLVGEGTVHVPTPPRSGGQRSSVVPRSDAYTTSGARNHTNREFDSGNAILKVKEMDVLQIYSHSMEKLFLSLQAHLSAKIGDLEKS